MATNLLDKEFTAGELTTWALKILGIMGYEVWRNNNITVKRRTFRGRPGVADITGYKRSNGLRVECEVKKIGDFLSKEQHEHLSALDKSGGIAFVAYQHGNEKRIDTYRDYCQKMKL